MRDYDAMRGILRTIAGSEGRVGYSALMAVAGEKAVDAELVRLIGDGLVDGEVAFGERGTLLACELRGLTAEGREFSRLVENDDVWSIVRATLLSAGLDVSYPLLKEVCEEVVKRYVTSFVPEVGRNGTVEFGS